MRRGPRVLAFALALFCLGADRGRAQTVPPATSAEQVVQVTVQGNVRVEEDAIRVQLRTRAGEPLNRDLVDRDIRAVYGMGFFDQVKADVAPAPDGRGVVVTFRVQERPLIRAVKIEGEEKIEREELESALRVRPRTILDPQKARQGVEAAKRLYADKGYLDVDVTFRTENVGENEVDLLYAVKEGEPIRVEEIEFEGNEAFSDRKLRGIMQTKTGWILSRFTGAGNLNKDVLRADMERLTAWYYDNGYVTVRVDEPRVERREDGLYVTVKIDEGEQFKVGSVKIEGKDLPPDSVALRSELATTEGEVFKASALREDVQRLTETLSDDGYAFANVEPQTEVNPETQEVAVVFQVERGRPVIVDRIEVTGNTKTRDKVVRREMRLQEQELFSGTKVRKSREALQRLGFFQEVNISTRRAAAEDKLDVVVNVKEAQTGAFSAGAGFSSADNLLFNVRIQENNLFGRGQRLVLQGDIGSIRRNIILSFTEPYLRETPLTLGVDAFSWRLEFDTFDREGTGAGAQLTYPVAAWGLEKLWKIPLDEVRVGAVYRIERAEINNLTFGATRSIRAEEGSSLISSITPRISRNTLNSAFDPTAGSAQSLGVEIAGLGGDQFLQVEVLERTYWTFWRPKWWGDLTYSFGGALGWGFGEAGLSGDELPLFERYFPGGINSIRGFQSRTMGPREARKNRFGQVVNTTPIGGSQQVILNNEIIFPIVPAIGLKGVVFVDAGNAYLAEEGFTLDETRYSVGAGVRWLSPLGPLRIELAEALNAEDTDETQLIGFSFGGPFQF